MDDAKFQLFEPDNKRRFLRIEGPPRNFVLQFLSLNITSRESLFEYLDTFQNLPEAEQDRRKCILLLASAHLGQFVLAEELLQARANPNCKMGGGSEQTPLQFAALARHPDTTRTLLSSPSIDINATDANGNTALMCAAQSGCQVVFDLLLDRRNLDVLIVNRQGFSALDFAIASGSSQMIKCILDKNPNASMEGRSENQHFYEACCFMACEQPGRVEILKYLSEHGMSLRIRRPESDATLLSTAILYKQIGVAKFLLNSDAWVDAEDAMGHTSLLYACRAGDLSMVQMLCDANCNINHTDKKGRNAVYIAACLGHKDIVVYLTKRGCNLDAVTKSGSNIWEAAITGGNLELYMYILSVHVARSGEIY